MPETPNSESVSTRQQRIAMLAKQSPQMAFTSLNHYLDLDWLPPVVSPSEGNEVRRDGRQEVVAC